MTRVPWHSLQCNHVASLWPQAKEACRSTPREIPTTSASVNMWRRSIWGKKIFVLTRVALVFQSFFLICSAAHRQSPRSVTLRLQLRSCTIGASMIGKGRTMLTHSSLMRSTQCFLRPSDPGRISIRHPQTSMLGDLWQVSFGLQPIRPPSFATSLTLPCRALLLAAPWNSPRQRSAGEVHHARAELHPFSTCEDPGRTTFRNYLS